MLKTYQDKKNEIITKYERRMYFLEKNYRAEVMSLELKFTEEMMEIDNVEG